jgi:hypothetical protein
MRSDATPHSALCCLTTLSAWMPSAIPYRLTSAMFRPVGIPSPFFSTIRYFKTNAAMPLS